MTTLDNRERARTPEKISPVNKVLIANRGEIAVRILKTCVERGIGAVVVATEPDKDSLAVRTALALSETDDRYSAAVLNNPGDYTNIALITEVAKAYECAALHPGYGFLAENPAAAGAAEKARVRFIGPNQEAILRLGDKNNAREVAKNTGTPLLPGTSTLTSASQALREAKRTHYPIMLKAQDAGGGAGNRVVRNETELREMYRELTALFPEIYLEKYVEKASHVEMQVVADNYGNVSVLGDRDCSAQRNFQKVIEESGQVNIPQKVRDKMAQDAIKMAKTASYRGLGTWEFLYDQDTGKYYFLEVNTRLQVEHPVTEERTGIDLVGLQIDIASGLSLPHALPRGAAERKNHIIEARVYAENPEHDFLGASGILQILDVPTIEGVRIDAGYEEGDVVPPNYDKTIVKLIAQGKTREEARQKLVQTLHELQVTGMPTNQDFLLWLLDTEEFKNGDITTTFIENAWNKHQAERLGALELTKYGHFIEEFPTPLLKDIPTDPDAPEIVYKRKGTKRYFNQEQKALQETEEGISAFESGIFEDEETGLRFAVGVWNYKKHGGSMGPEEGFAVGKMLEEASLNSLPVIMFTNSAGVTQLDNSQGLTMMDYVMAARAEYPVPLFVNIYVGNNYGGVNASIAEGADFTLAADRSRIGFTGPDFVAKIMNKKDRSELPQGAHTNSEHELNATLEMGVRDVNMGYEVARLLAAGYLGKLTTRQLKELSEKILPYTSVEDIRPVDNPDGQRMHAVVAPVGKLDSAVLPKIHTGTRHLIDRTWARGHGLVEAIRHRREHRQETTIFQSRSVIERLRIILDPKRPTAADFLNLKYSEFADAVIPLSNGQILSSPHGYLEQYRPIIAAIAYIDEKPIMVIGQQPSRQRNASGDMEVKYVNQRPEDFAYAKEMMDLANRQGMEILLLGNTSGGAADLGAEYRGINAAVSNFIEYPYLSLDVPVFSFNYGLGGSGGGKTFIRPLNFAGAFENSLEFVSQLQVMTSIVNGLTDRWPTDEEIEELGNQLENAKAEISKKMEHIDEVLRESEDGSAQPDMRFMSRELRKFVLLARSAMEGKSVQEIKEDRFARSKKAASYGTRPNL